jgi:hypothetical protein
MFIRLILEKPAIIGIPVVIGILGNVAEEIKADRGRQVCKRRKD